MTPTQRSLAYLRKMGHTVAIVEKWNPHAKIRQDLFGFIDIVALDGLPGLLGVQTTSGSNVSARIKKAQDSPNLALWLKAGNRFHVHGWRKAGARGKRKIWELRLVEVTDAPPTAPEPQA